jgi:hypothetical protein
MRLTAAQHARIALAYMKDAAEASLTLEQKRELQAAAGRHQALAKLAKKLERSPD